MVWDEKACSDWALREFEARQHAMQKNTKQWKADFMGISRVMVFYPQTRAHGMLRQSRTRWPACPRLTEHAMRSSLWIENHHPRNPHEIGFSLFCILLHGVLSCLELPQRSVWASLLIPYHRLGLRRERCRQGCGFLHPGVKSHSLVDIAHDATQVDGMGWEGLIRLSIEGVRGKAARHAKEYKVIKSRFHGNF